MSDSLKVRLLIANAIVVAGIVGLTALFRAVSMDFVYGALFYAALFHVCHRIGSGRWYGEEDG